MKKLLFTLLLAAVTLPGWALSQDNGVYQISTAQDLVDFASLVNGGTGNANAVLTTDIDMTGVTSWTPIGQDMKDYKGHFNGQGHRILNFKVDNYGTHDNQALFGQAVGGAIIENVIIDSSCEIKGKSYTAGILGHVWGDGVIVRNCGNEGTITGSGGNAAGIIGCSEKKVYISNCYNSGSITGSHESAAICAWMGDGASTIANCYNTGSVTGQDGTNRMYRKAVTATNLYDIDGVQGTQFTNAQLASGELCFRLNGDQSTIAWYQTLGETDADAHPYPFAASSHAQVYGNGELKCDGTAAEGGTLTYSNSETSTIPPHTFTTPSTGFCSVCGAYEPNALTATDGWYEISLPWQLRWMAESVTKHNSTYKNANIKLNDDIDYTAYTNQAAMFGDDGNYYEGTFDGQFHTVTVAFENTTANETALFRRIQNATIQNLKVAGNITTDKKFAGGICTEIKNHGTIQNCWSAVDINDTASSGDATHGGILAKTNISGADINIQIKNCLYSGNLTATNREGNGGIVGWTSNSEDVHVSNCLVIGDLSFADNGNNGVIARSSGDFSNNYYTSDVSSYSNIKKTDYGTAKEATDLTSGALCYILNGNVSAGTNWYQNLESNVDPTPVPFSSHSLVYANGDLNCDGTSKGAAQYSNTEGENRDAHNYQDGICTVCKAFNVNYLNLVDGFYEIGNMNGLNWFSKYVNAGNPTVNAKLTADIAMQSENELEYTPIGSADHPYRGHFNGQGHSVTLKINNSGYNYQGLFGIITDGVSIEKVIVKGTVIGNDYVGGIAGGTNGGSSNVKKTNIWYCGNEATIIANGANGAGIIGVNKDGSASVILLNCYNTGNITSNREGGAMSGWLGGGWSNVRNCYNSGTIKNNGADSKAFGRNNGCYFTNCYYTESSGTDNSTENHDNGQITEAADATLASGELCYLLNGDQSEIAFRQLLGTDTYPTTDFNNNKPQVYELAVSDAEYASFVPTVNIPALPTGVKAYVGQIQNNGSSLHLEEVTALPANNAFVVNAAEGNYYYNNTSETVTLSETNDLQVATTAFNPTTENTIYCLAKKNGNVGFYPVATTVTIPARKVYLEIASGVVPVKGFFGFEEDDATGISLTPALSEGEGEIYNLAGQRIQKMQKGINIVNGKKVMVK